MTASLVSLPTRGTVTMNSNGTFTYIPGATALFGTTDSFTYRATDVFGASSPQTTVTITIGRPPQPKYQNPSQQWDVNADGFISPIDVLILVNLLNSRGPSVPVAGLPGPPDYVDVNGDNVVTPLDVLAVIDKINAASGSGEGEGTDGSEIGRFTVGPGLVDSTGGGTAAPIDFGVSRVQVGRELPTSATSVGSVGMMRGISGLGSSSMGLMSLSNDLVGDLLDSDLDEIAGLLSEAGDVGLNDEAGEDPLDRALIDLFGN
jgi:hypothetical protein